MAVRLSRKRGRAGGTLSLFAVLLLAAGSLPPGSVLASYSFEDDVETGPDTFAVFQHAKGTVSLSRAFRLSGYRALEIRDTAGDRDFPELQGYFEARTTGRVFAHFAFLTAEPEEEWNAALAGPSWFTLGKDGIAFWLAAHDGMLVHHSDSIPKRLFRLEPFVWYAVDLAYDVAKGEYDLTIRQEGRAEPVVALKGQKNAASHPGSAVDKFSFIGDLSDLSRATYYVDDVVLGTDEAVTLLPFVAPGRRKLFVDGYREQQRRQRDGVACPLALDPRDFGLEATDFAAAVPAARAWQEGCALLASGEAEKALAVFDQASPPGGIHRLSAVLALARLKRGGEAARRLEQLGPEWHDDPRYAVAAALVGEAPEHSHFFLLEEGRFAEAREQAVEKAAAAKGGAGRAEWLEHAADAALLAGSPAEARDLYERSQAASRRPSVLLKLSDVAFLLGDLEAERHWREQIYGALRER